MWTHDQQGRGPEVKQKQSTEFLVSAPELQDRRTEITTNTWLDVPGLFSLRSLQVSPSYEAPSTIRNSGQLSVFGEPVTHRASSDPIKINLGDMANPSLPVKVGWTLGFALAKGLIGGHTRCPNPPPMILLCHLI